MSCILDTGIQIGCVDSIAGIRRVLIANFNETAVFTEAAGIVTAIAYTSPAETFYQFKFLPQTANLGQEGAHSLENGTVFYTQTVSMQFHKLDTAKRNAILLLAKLNSHVIVEDQNGTYWLVGRTNAAYVSASTANTGQAYGDLSGFTVALTALEPQLAIEVTSAAIATLTIV